MKLTLIKIGGSLITDKEVAFSLKERALRVICEEILRAQGEYEGGLIVGHGAGSFAHVPAKKYETHKGIKREESYRGIAEVADVAGQLNRIVMKQLLEVGVNAMSFAPHSFMVADNHGLDDMWTEGLELALKRQQLPVVYGDQMLDREVGCTIFSTEKVLGYLAMTLKDKGYEVEQVIHCGLTNGVLDGDGNTIERIDGGSFGEVSKMVGASNGTDVTGGMLHKVEEALALAKQGIPGLIIDGIENGSLAEAVMGREVVGTRIER